MTVSLLWIALSCLILFGGAEALIRGSASLALRLGLTPLVVGLTVVAYGTSMPELIVSTKAAMAGQSDIAIGNVVGSNVFNIAIILGLSALAWPVTTHLQILRWDAPLLIVVTLAMVALAIDGEVSRAEGIGLALGAVAYTIIAVRMARKDGHAGCEAHIDVPETKTTKRGAWFDVLLILCGLGLLVLGSRVLVTHAVAVAKTLQVSEAVIGLTIVAAGTSMPELATSLVAALRKQSDIALGNVMGSNIFNLLFVLGASATIHPVATGAVTRIDWIALVVVTVAVFPMLWSGRRVNRAEGLLLVLCYGVYLMLMWPTEGPAPSLPAPSLSLP